MSKEEKIQFLLYDQLSCTMCWHGSHRDNFNRMWTRARMSIFHICKQDRESTEERNLFPCRHWMWSRMGSLGIQSSACERLHKQDYLKAGKWRGKNPFRILSLDQLINTIFNGWTKFSECHLMQKWRMRKAFDNFSNFHNGTTVLKLMLMSSLLLRAFDPLRQIEHNTFSLSYFHGILEGTQMPKCWNEVCHMDHAR